MGRWARLILLCVAAFWVTSPDKALPAEEVLAAAPAFVGSEVCKKCHEYRHETWLKTAHAYSLRKATPEHVKGRFDGRVVEACLHRSRNDRRFQSNLTADSNRI